MVSNNVTGAVFSGIPPTVQYQQRLSKHLFVTGDIVLKHYISFKVSAGGNMQYVNVTNEVEPVCDWPLESPDLVVRIKTRPVMSTQDYDFTIDWGSGAGAEPYKLHQYREGMWLFESPPGSTPAELTDISMAYVSVTLNDWRNVIDVTCPMRKLPYGVLVTGNFMMGNDPIAAFGQNYLPGQSEKKVWTLAEQNISWQPDSTMVMYIQYHETSSDTNTGMVKFGNYAAPLLDDNGDIVMKINVYNVLHESGSPTSYTWISAFIGGTAGTISSLVVSKTISALGPVANLLTGMGIDIGTYVSSLLDALKTAEDEYGWIRADQRNVAQIIKWTLQALNVLNDETGAAGLIGLMAGGATAQITSLLSAISGATSNGIDDKISELMSTGVSGGLIQAGGGAIGAGIGEMLLSKALLQAMDDYPLFMSCGE